MLVVTLEHKQNFQELQNHIPVLPEAPKPYTSALGGYITKHWRTRWFQNHVLAHLVVSEPCTGAPGGSKTLYQHSPTLQNLALVLPEAPAPCTSASGGSRTLHRCSWRLREAPGCSAECVIQNQPPQPLEGPRRLTLPMCL
jgi:hypothetical protein